MLPARRQAAGRVTSGSLAAGAAGGVLGFAGAVLGAVVSAFTVLILSLYFLAALPAFKDAIVGLSPASRRARAGYLTDQIFQRISSYISGTAVVAIIAGVLSYIFLMIIGLREYALALAVLVAVLDIIPLIGATLAGSGWWRSTGVLTTPVDCAGTVAVVVGDPISWQQLEAPTNPTLAAHDPVIQSAGGVLPSAPEPARAVRRMRRELCHSQATQADTGGSVRIRWRVCRWVAHAAFRGCAQPELCPPVRNSHQLRRPTLQHFVLPLARPLTAVKLGRS